MVNSHVCHHLVSQDRVPFCDLMLQTHTFLNATHLSFCSQKFTKKLVEIGSFVSFLLLSAFKFVTCF